MNPYEEQIDDILATLTIIFQAEGKVKEVSILGSSKVEFTVLSAREVVHYSLKLSVPLEIFNKSKSDIQRLEKSIYDSLCIFTSEKGHKIVCVKINPQMIHDNEWKEKSARWLGGGVLTNQGRVRSDKVASLSFDGLLFRSYPEIHLYKALKAAGVTFSPLPVFIKGGEKYRRIEPDFIIIRNGRMIAIEVDGDAIHHESPFEAHERLTMLTHEGVVIERINAEDCITEEKARQCVPRLIEVLDKLTQLR